jgi:hypothetical protein
LLDCDEYFTHVEKLILFEEDLFDDILEGNDSLSFIGKDIKQLLFEKLLDNYRTTFVDSDQGLKSFITEKNYAGLKRMTKLYSKFENKYDIIKEGYRDVLVTIKSGLISNYKSQIANETDEMKKMELKKNPTLIGDLIKIYIEHNKIIRDCLSKNHEFKVMQNKSLEVCLNIKNLGFSMPLLMATFTNDTLKKASKTTDEVETRDILDGVVSFLGALEEKDRFLYHFSRFLSKRLLDSDLESLGMLEWDRYLIQTKKSKLGPEITKNFEAMVNDVQVWYENRDEFKQYLTQHFIAEQTKKSLVDQETAGAEQIIAETQSANPFGGGLSNIPNVHVNVLAACELQVPIPITMTGPAQITDIQRLFEKFYKGKPYNLNKNIEWVYFYGTVEVKYKFSEMKSYFLVMKPYQYFLLALFEDNKSLTYQQINEA